MIIIKPTPIILKFNLILVKANKPRIDPEIKKFSLKFETPQSKKTIKKKFLLFINLFFIKMYSISAVVNWGKIRNLEPDNKKTIIGELKIKRLKMIFISLFSILLEKYIKKELSPKNCTIVPALSE